MENLLDDCIGISENRLKHSYNVAKECYKIANEIFNRDDTFCDKMFVIGFNHDIGYEFTPKEAKHTHNEIGAVLISDAIEHNKETEFSNAIKWHGNPNTPDDMRTLEWYILNMADMTVDSKGIKVTMDTRLKDIASRQGTNSMAYKDASEIARQLREWLKMMEAKYNIDHKLLAFYYFSYYL
jgi:predicted hydrolase (HD superfamily)